MPSKWTFEIKPILQLLKKYGVGSGWADPFAGKSKLAEFRNDLNIDHQQPYSMEALEFLKTINKHTLKGCIFDPPYSLTQVSRSYKEIGLTFKGKENPTGGFPSVKDLMSELVQVDGHVISFGWNTIGMGKKRGFSIVEILIVSHGGNRNDTLCTVEKKQPGSPILSESERHASM